MREFVKLRHASLVRSDDVCTEHGDVFDVNPGTKNTRLALHGYVAESTRLRSLQALGIFCGFLTTTLTVRA